MDIIHEQDGLTNKKKNQHEEAELGIKRRKIKDNKKEKDQKDQKR